MELTFYDNEGRAVAYTEDGLHIYLFDGTSVAYIEGNSIYTYSGKHLGWLEDGWVMEHSGKCVFFTETSSAYGPIKPIKHIKPIKNIKQINPIKSIKEIQPFKPVRQLLWSDFSGEEFFYQ